MKKGWTVTKLIVIGGLAALMSALMVLGATITAATGQIALGGIINGFITPAIAILCLYLIDQFGAVSLLFLIFAILTISLPLAGPPGWIIKIPIRFFGGLIVDALYILLKRNKLVSALLLGAILQIYTGISVFGLGLLLKVEFLKESAKIFFSPVGIIIAIFFGCVGGYVGHILYGKMKNSSIVKRIQQ